jgi:hypothetical protein
VRENGDSLAVELIQPDLNLVAVVEAWPRLTDDMRAGIAAMVRASI